MKRGHAKEVRDFGTMLAHDHAQVRQRGRDLAAKLSVTPRPPADDASGRAHAAAMKHLRTLKGAEFDHAFLQHEVAFHKAVIDAVTTTLLPAIHNAEVKALVVKVAPAFQAHMVAQQLDETLTTIRPRSRSLSASTRPSSRREKRSSASTPSATRSTGRTRCACTR